jgi:hypothetical protein
VAKKRDDKPVAGGGAAGTDDIVVPLPAADPSAPATPPRAAKLPTQNGKEMAELFSNYVDDA